MNSRALKPLLLVVLGLIVSLCSAQQKVAWSSKVLSGDAKPGAKVVVELDAAIQPKWHLYALPPTKASNIPTTIDAEAPAKIDGTVTQDKPELKFDNNFSAQVEFFETSAKFTVPVVLGPDGKGNLKVRYQACNDRMCLPPTTVTVPIGGSVLPAVSASSAAATGSLSLEDQIKGEQQKGLLSFILFAFGAGLLALLTPCVFPMVPITVSYFSKQRDAQGNRPGIAQPVAYCLGIISAFTGFGLIVTILFGASGIQKFATNPIVNLVLAALFIFLALNLFGVYEISLPVSLQNRFSPRGKSGLLGPILMGLTFTLTSFTCTVPFVGTILVNATHGDVLYPFVGMLAFSSAFALPFFLLALFPQYLAKLPKSGSWLAAVKGFMGFLEVAAAVKFFSNSDLVWGTGILSRTAFLGVWVVVFAVAALFLSGIVKLPKVEMPKKFGPGRMAILALTVLTVGLMGYGMTGGSLGELEAYLPPSKSGWLENYRDAVDLARRSNRPIFINFTGVTCTNCRWMEKNMFTRKDVTQALKKYVLLELYTDKQSKEDELNQALQQKLTGTVTLPIYVSVSPEGKVLKTFGSSTRDADEFLRFLRDGSIVGG
ncbi:MAG: cytochrome c biogenesis protein CcdA [Fimbriimonas sp.]|nr:cytochrome c biogenesis protein CcdA [Fimbriimonas sp.]